MEVGFTFQKSDVTYRAVFSASCQRPKGPTDKQVRCTVIGKEPKHPGCFGPSDLKPHEFPKDHAVNAAVDIFGDGNVRFYGDGVPNVFLDSEGKATEAMLERLLNWSPTVVG